MSRFNERILASVRRWLLIVGVCAAVFTVGEVICRSVLHLPDGLVPAIVLPTSFVALFAMMAKTKPPTRSE